MATPEQIKRLVDAMEQLLDDMGTSGQSVCLAAKAQARVAYEPFVDEEVREFYMALADAERVLKECDG